MQSFLAVGNMTGAASSTAVTYFAGNDFTAADIMSVFALTTIRLFQPMDLAPYPNVRR